MQLAQGVHAVGGANTTGNPKPLAERWDGTSWTVQKTPHQQPRGLNAVSCGSATACTAIGPYHYVAREGNGQETLLAEEWDDVSWSVRMTPRFVVTASASTIATELLS